MAIKLPTFTKRLDPLAGTVVMKCSGCRLKFLSYGKYYCGNCSKEK